MNKSRGKGINSAEFVQNLANCVALPVPHFVQLTAAAAEFWPTFSSARASQDWQEHELLALANLCNMEADARRYQEQLDEMGPIVTDRYGTPKANPLAGMINRLRAQQLAIMRALSISTVKASARTTAAHAQKRKQLKNTFEADTTGLLAKPSNYSN